MIFFCGIDIGSLSTDCVIIDNEKNILGFSIIPTGHNAMEAAIKAQEIALAKADISKDKLLFTVSTGYGRYGTSLSKKSFTEITCHAMGALHFFPNVKCVIDVGGQDSKIIKISQTGKVEDFMMNDKCAAGTGRFIEVMANSLNTPLEEMGTLGLKSKKDININSTCTVFAESEVIALVAKNIPKADIVNSIHKSISKRLKSMVTQMKCSPPYVMTGGVAKNIGIKKALEDTLKKNIDVISEPQIVGATGAALLAKREYHKISTELKTK